MSRGLVFTIVVLPVLLLSVGTCHALQDEAADGTRPNIILIMADDVGVEAFGCYGGTSYQTPTIDTLAEAGVRFTQCHAQPLCTPSRVKIMTGRSNIYNYVRFGCLAPDEPTFGHMMQQAGYATAVAGKWQLYGIKVASQVPGSGSRPRQAGFDEYCLWQIDQRDSRYWKPLIEQNGQIIDNVDDRFGPDLFTEFICDFIDRHREEPFFIYFPMALVHDPFIPTPDSADRNSKDRQRNFADMMAYTDRIVGRIDEQLSESGVRDNTLLMFTADNGTGRGIRSMMGSTEVRGGKGSTTNTGTHVPLVVNWPAQTADGGYVCDDLVDLSDFVPTIAQAAGIDVSDTKLKPEGHSFLPQIRGERGRPREWIFCYYNPRPGNPKFPERRFARNQRWKLYGNGDLFDLQTDPAEQQPIDPADQPDEAAEARAALQEVIDSYPKEPVKIPRPATQPVDR